jgi:hypothetical protein
MPDDRYTDLEPVWNERLFRRYADFTDHPVRTVTTWIVSIVVVVALLGVIGNALGIANVYWQAEQAKLTVNPRVTQAVYGTSNALVNIAYFHNQCNTILADQTNVENATTTLAQDKATLASASDPIAQQQAGQAVTQDDVNLLGAKDQLSTDVRDYDSKSATQTANPFKAHNLPYRIQINPTTGLLAGSVNCR